MSDIFALFRTSKRKSLAPMTFIGDHYYFPCTDWVKSGSSPQPGEVWQVEKVNGSFLVSPVQLVYKAEEGHIVWSDSWVFPTACTVAFVLRTSTELFKPYILEFRDGGSGFPTTIAEGETQTRMYPAVQWCKAVKES